MTKGSRRAGGFTLVELILVMIVIFTLATVVAPRFTDFFPSFQVRKSGELLLAWAHKAKSDAALTGARQRLALDLTNRKFWIEVEMRPLKEPGKFTALSGAWSPETLPGEVMFESIEITPVDASSSSGSLRYIEFRPDGTAGEATVIVANDVGDRQTLRVEAATSKIYLQSAEQQP